MLSILYRDEHLVAVSKPPGLLVHRTGLDAGETQFALQMLRDQLGCHLWPLHRLDKGTSGVLVFGFSAEVARRMGPVFEGGHGLEKTYRAIARGWPPTEGFIDHPLRRMPDDMRTQRLEHQPAQTKFWPLRHLELSLAYGEFPMTRLAEVELQPLTGRRHQLRRHLKHINHPLIGDSTHGKGPLNRAVSGFIGVTRLWLHALRLTLPHPMSGEGVTIEAPLTDDWALWDAFVVPGQLPMPSGAGAPDEVA